MLCRYVGCEHWNAFVVSLHKQSSRESDVISDGASIKVEDLAPGDRIRIGWLPDRICIVEYVGGRTFKAIDTRNSTLQIGDTFECSVMLKNYPLFVDNLVHGGEHCQRYSIGLNCLRTEMSTFYIPARDSMFRQQTFAAASVFKGEYLLRYVHFRDSLPADQHLACEEIFAEQSAVLDSVLVGLQ